MTDTTIAEAERRRRWKLALGDAEGLAGRDAGICRTLSSLYGSDAAGSGSSKRFAGSGRSIPHAMKWLDDVTEFFPESAVKVIQRDAFERLDLKTLLVDPRFLESVEADIHVVAQIMALRGAVPERAREAARHVVRKVVDEMMERLKTRTEVAIRGAVDRRVRTRRPRHSDIDWNRTIAANLRHWQPEPCSIVPETLIGFSRKSRSRADLDEVHVLSDQSGSMARSVVYSSIFSAVMASLKAISTRLYSFDTAVIDHTDALADPVDILFGIQMGGGTDIAGALRYVQNRIARPSKAHLVLISDLIENGVARNLLAISAALVSSGVNMIVLLALSDEGRPAYSEENARALAALGCPVFACAPDLFPALMSTALQRGDIHAWVAANDVSLVRPA